MPGSGHDRTRRGVSTPNGLALIEDPEEVDVLPLWSSELTANGHHLSIVGDNTRATAHDLACPLDRVGRTVLVGCCGRLRVKGRRPDDRVVLAVIATGPHHDCLLSVRSEERRVGKEVRSRVAPELEE